MPSESWCLMPRYKTDFMQQLKNVSARWVLPLAVGGALYALLGSVIAKADVISDLLGNQLLCRLAERDLANMPVEPLFQITDGQCNSVVPENDDGAWFGDAQCTVPVTYSRTRMQDYCAAAANRSELGNGLNILSDAWTLNPGNQLDLGARSLDGVKQPYMQRLVYRQVQTARGRCDLEMRVYKSHPNATGQRSMIALHGGSWTSRSFGFLGLELSVPHFVDQGFVVYAPFYRLLDDTDSSAACNQADFSEIVEDGNAALDWVLDNASRYGSSGAPLVFGQSAGAHLALSLSVNSPSLVSGAVLMYPPTDFSDFLLRVQSGAYTNPQGLGVLERVVGSSPESTSLSLPLVLDNSFPARVANEGAAWPPMFIVHGSADELVEARQSVRLCDALAGRELASTSQEVGNAEELRDVIVCGSSTQPASQLHLLQLGDHALDVCLNPNIPDLCLSGGSASRSLVAQSIGESVSFSVAAHQSRSDAVSTGSDTNTSTDTGDTGSVSTGGGGGGSLAWLSVLVLVLLPKLRQRLQ